MHPLVQLWFLILIMMVSCEIIIHKTENSYFGGVAIVGGLLLMFLSGLGYALAFKS